MIGHQLSFLPYALLGLPLGVHEFALSIAFTFLEHADVVVSEEEEYAAVAIEFVVLELALLYFCVAENDAANAFQGIGATFKLANQKVVDFPVCFKFELRAEQVDWLVRIPYDFFH